MATPTRTVASKELYSKMQPVARSNLTDLPLQKTTSPYHHSQQQYQPQQQYKHSSVSTPASTPAGVSSSTSAGSSPASRNHNRLFDVENGLNAMSTVAASQLERKTALQSANFWKMLSDVRNRSLNRAKLKQSSQVSALLSGFALVFIFSHFTS